MAATCDDPRVGYQAIVEELLAATGATRTTLRLDTPGRNFPAVAEALSPGTPPIAQDESIDQRNAATAQWLFRELRPLVQHDLDVDPPRPPQGLLDVYGVRAQMLGPIVLDGELVGWLSVHQAGAPRRWADGDLAALERAMAAVRAELGAGEP